MEKVRLTFLTAMPLLAGTVLAATHYVDINSAYATPPYTNWATAATNIQDAVDAAVAGDEIVVTNGTYANGGGTNALGHSRVVLDKPVSLRSVNGPGITAIVGGFGGIRCAYLTNGASLSGFSLSGGNLVTKGAGVFCESRTAVVSNCFLYSNGATYGSSAGGGAYGGTLNNCTLDGNTTGSNNLNPTYGGGAAYCTLNHCRLMNNYAWSPYGRGGGAYGCILNNCRLTGSQGTGADSSTLNNCIIYNSSASGAASCTLFNCTLTGNMGYGAYGSSLNNCIVYYNNINNTGNSTGCTLSYCCTTPDPGGIGNITRAPLLVGNLVLQSNSPCINAANNAYVVGNTDLDGNPRIVGGTVDIGAYEYQAPVSQISYAWLHQYGLPINAATDSADPDGDGVDNYHEWLAGTDPTSPLSSPAQLTITPSGLASSRIILTWSTNAVGFSLQSAAELGSPAPWSTNLPLPVVIGNQNVVTNPLSGPRQFFRLIH